MNAADIRDRLAAVAAEAGPEVTIVLATKYVALEDMAALVDAGVAVVGENRAQDLERKHAEYGDAFRWHFIGRLQSNKARIVNGICELVHSVDSDSTARRLTIPALLEVNLTGELSKAGIAEGDVAGFLKRFPSTRGLMTMPSPTAEPETSRLAFRRLRALAVEHGLKELSMGTSQDWRIAVEEGATMIRLGATILEPASGPSVR